MEDVVVSDIVRAEVAGQREILNLCQQLGLIPADDDGPTCSDCGSKLYLGVESGAIDGYVWRCGGYLRREKKKAQRCTKRVSIRVGTIFEVRIKVNSSNKIASFLEV